MASVSYPVIDLAATGSNIVRLRKERGLSVRDLQNFMGFEEPQAIYKWQWGKSLPSVDNLFALAALLGVSMNDIIVQQTPANNKNNEQQENSCCSFHFLRFLWTRRKTTLDTPIFLPVEPRPVNNRPCISRFGSCNKHT